MESNKVVRFVRDKNQKPLFLRHDLTAECDDGGFHGMYSRLFQCGYFGNFINGYAICNIPDLRNKESAEPPETIDIEIWEMQNEEYLWQHVGWEKIEGFKAISAEHSDPETSACMLMIKFSYSKFTSGIVPDGKIVDVRKLETPKYPWLEVEKFI